MRSHPPPPAPKILREGPGDLVVWKPPGMASELTTDPHGASLIGWLRRQGHAGARLCHRLDRGTQGLLVVGLSRESAAFHGAQITARRWAKHYLARVRAPAEGVELGRISGYLREAGGRVELVRSGGKAAHMDLLAAAPAPGRRGELHLLIRLLTGRRHQIRALLSGRGLPLTGDEAYGGGPGSFYLDHVLLGLPAWPSGDWLLLRGRPAEALDPGLQAALDGLHPAPAPAVGAAPSALAPRAPIP